MPPVSDHSDVGVTSQPGLFSSPGSTEERKTAPANNHTGVEAAFQALGIPCEANIKIELKKHLSLLEENGENENATVEVLNAPLFTQSVREHTLGLSKPEPEPTTYSQYGLLAGDINGPSSQNRDPRIFYNIAAPSSVFICGSQGSGKSHSLSCLLENALIPSDANVLPKPLTGIAFHYDTFISDTGGSPCEVAFLSSHKGVKVRVLCAPTNIAQIRVSNAYFCGKRKPC